MKNEAASAYQELVQAIVKAVPDIVERCNKICDKCGISRMREGTRDECCGDEVFPCSGILRPDGDPKNEMRRPITLEDVLRWLQQTLGINGVEYYAAVTAGTVHKLNIVTRGSEANWHLGHDLAWHRYNAPETISFLHSLLIP